MASLQQPATGYRTQYYNCGSFLSVTFPILRECKKQLKERETENAIEPAHRIRLGELLRGYGKKSNIKQKSATDESRRIKRLKDRCLDRMGKSIGDVNTNNVSPGVGQNGRCGLVKQFFSCQVWDGIESRVCHRSIIDWG
ncbi:MAG TPA: hypothetical protein VKZ94_02120 [Advenella sp.]|nr:hypothetical protein [Advenella sp.]